MTLQALLESFTDYASKQSHVEPLLPMDEKVISFQFGNEGYSLKLSRQAIMLVEGIHGTDTIICRRKEDVESLVNGEVRLQLLLSWKGLEYTGAYRTMLLAESLFHICRPLRKGA